MMHVTVAINRDVIHEIHIQNLGPQSVSAELLRHHVDARIYRYRCCDVTGQLLHYRDDGAFTLLTKVVTDLQKRHRHALRA